MPEKVGELAEKLIWAVPAVIVKPAADVSVIPKLKEVPLKVAVPVPKSNVLVFKFTLDKPSVVKL